MDREIKEEDIYKEYPVAWSNALKLLYVYLLLWSWNRIDLTSNLVFHKFYISYVCDMFNVSQIQ